VYTFVATVPFTLVIYWMVGFTNEADPFFLFLLTVGGLSLAFNSFGHLIVALVPNVAVAGIFGGLFMYACKCVGEFALAGALTFIAFKSYAFIVCACSSLFSQFCGFYIVSATCDAWPFQMYLLLCREACCCMSFVCVVVCGGAWETPSCCCHLSLLSLCVLNIPALHQHSRRVAVVLLGQPCGTCSSRFVPQEMPLIASCVMCSGSPFWGGGGGSVCRPNRHSLLAGLWPS
jgi:hypothetical protein